MAINLIITAVSLLVCYQCVFQFLISLPCLSVTVILLVDNLSLFD